MEIAQPSGFERLLILLAQGIFFISSLTLYVVSGRTAHRLIGYFEEEAVYGYGECLADVDCGCLENVPAPKIAIDYWKLPADARLRDVILVIRQDEAGHRDVNHRLANSYDVWTCYLVVTSWSPKLREVPIRLSYTRHCFYPRCKKAQPEIPRSFH